MWACKALNGARAASRRRSSLWPAHQPEERAPDTVPPGVVLLQGAVPHAAGAAGGGVEDGESGKGSSDAESDAESEGSWEGDGERTCEMCNEVRRARCRLCLIWGRRDETERFVC